MRPGPVPVVGAKLPEIHDARASLWSADARFESRDLLTSLSADAPSAALDFQPDTIARSYGQMRHWLGDPILHRREAELAGQ